MLQQTLKLLLLLPLAAQAAIFPEHIGTFDKGAPTSLTMPDRALLDEFGLEATEQAEYKSDAKHFTATAWRFRDSTGAMAFFQAHRPSGATAAPLAKLAAATSAGAYIHYEPASERMQADFRKGLDTMPRNTETPASAPDWRAEAENRGRAAFESAVADPQPPPEPLSWLWKNSRYERNHE